MRLTIAAIALLALLSGVGCGVHRRMTIVSKPPGAMVYIDDQPIGLTPVSTSFTYYGTRKFQLVKGGFETITELRNIEAPFYQIPPLDFVTDNFSPREIRDERELRFELTPQRIVPPEQLAEQAKQLRAQSRAAATALATPQTPAAPPPEAIGPGSVFTPPPAALDPMNRP